MEDETGQFQFQGHLEGAQSATYYLLMMQGKEFVAIPAGSWYDQIYTRILVYVMITVYCFVFFRGGGWWFKDLLIFI